MSAATGVGAGASAGPHDAWHVLELAAIHHADRLAVVDCAVTGRQLSYGQLFERATALAAHLRASGVRRGTRVALLSRNSAHVIEAHFAAAALHAVVVNLNIHLAPRELAFICADAAPVLVLADTHAAPALLAAHAELREQAGASRPGGSTPVFNTVVWMRVEGDHELPAPAEGLQVGQDAAPHRACPGCAAMHPSPPHHNPVARLGLAGT